MEARIILSHYLKCSIEELIINQYTLEEYSEILNDLVNQRIAKKPLAYILGSKEFHGRDFIVNENVLIPRPDTEILIDAVLKGQKNNKTNILELGVGSGCIIITLLLELKNSIGIGVDISEKALNVAMQNTLLHHCNDRLTLIKSDWFDNIDSVNKFDLIISNPPYIHEEEKYLMSDETIYEPELALYTKSYESYKQIAQHSKNYLSNEGLIYIEIGINQETNIIQIFNDENYILKDKFLDLAQIVRVLVFSPNYFISCN